MDRRCDINMNPDTGPIKAQMGTNKEAGAGALGVLTVLSKKKGITDNKQKPDTVIATSNNNQSLAHLK